MSPGRHAVTAPLGTRRVRSPTSRWRLSPRDGSADRAPGRALGRGGLMRQGSGCAEQELLVGVRGQVWARQVAVWAGSELREPALGVIALGDDGDDPARYRPQDGEHRSSSMRDCFGSCSYRLSVSPVLPHWAYALSLRPARLSRPLAAAGRRSSVAGRRTATLPRENARRSRPPSLTKPCGSTLAVPNPDISRSP